jgi:hypothetical protein
MHILNGFRPHPLGRNRRRSLKWRACPRLPPCPLSRPLSSAKSLPTWTTRTVAPASLSLRPPLGLYQRSAGRFRRFAGRYRRSAGRWSSRPPWSWCPPVRSWSPTASHLPAFPTRGGGGWSGAGSSGNTTGLCKPWHDNCYKNFIFFWRKD